MAALTVYVTTESRDEALRIGRAVVEARLAACANLLGAARSIYWWQGKIEDSDETVLILKTTESNYPALEAKIRALHSYDCPCIVAWPIAAGNPDYLAWLSAETKSE